MRFGSVCSGIEAASVAWEPLGWKAAWFSEIEPFPCAVLAHHYPEVPNLGDMTLLPERIAAGEVEAPDVFCGGTPCQAFSVAGKRQSLDDARGNLSLVFCEIANAIDDVRANAGTPPSIVFWENVPGVLSTKDNAFGCFLGELAGEECPIEPPRGKWSNAGCVYGPKRAIAWRVLDAQYFGVAQRRRRVFVVASARTDIDPATILFEFDSLRRDTAPSRETRKELAGGVEIGPSGGRFTELNPTLDTRAKDGPVRNQPVGCVLQFTEGHRMMAFGEYVSDNAASTIKACDYKSATDLVTYGIPGNRIGRAPENGGNAAEPMHDVAPCLTKADRHGVAHPVGVTIHGTDGTARVASFDETAQCLRARTPGNIDNSSTTVVAQPVVVHGTQDPCVSDIAFAQGRNNGGENVVALAVALRGREGGATAELGDEVQNCLRASSGGGDKPHVLTQMAVRRLTPVECERLQGFPDDYTMIPWRNKPAGECPDGPRYKALGNSWAVPNVRWIGERIQLAAEVAA